MNSPNEKSDQHLDSLIIKKYILKNITVLLLAAALTFWVIPYIEAGQGAELDVFFFLSIFPLGAMFAYFAFRYSDTDIHSADHRAMADIATFIFLTIICFSICLTALVAIKSIPTLKYPFIVLSGLLILGCVVYDFWNLFCRLKRK